MSLENLKKELKLQHEQLLKEASQVAQALAFLGNGEPALGDQKVKRRTWKMSPEAIEKMRAAAKKRWAAIKKKAPVTRKSD